MMKKVSLSTLILVCFALVMNNLGSGAYGVLVTKFAEKNHADPLVFSLFRDVFALPVLFLAAYVAERKLVIPAIRELPMFMLFGFLLVLSQTCYIVAIYYVSTDLASMFQPLSIIWVCVLSVMMRLESVPNIKTLHGIAKVFGILLAITGGFLAAYGRYLKNTSSSHVRMDDKLAIYGYLALIGNTLALSVFVVFEKKYVFENQSSRFKCFPVTITAWSYVFALIFISVACLYNWNKPEKFLSVTNDTVYPLIYAVFITSCLCFMIISWSVMEVDSSLVSAFSTLKVFFCILLAYLVLGETLTPIEIVGGLMMIVALFSVLWSNYRENSLRNYLLVNETPECLENQ